MNEQECMSKTKKRTIFITGGGQGIGQAIAFRFAADGSNIVIASKDSQHQIRSQKVVPNQTSGKK